MVNETTKALTNVIESLREKLQIKVDFASLNSMKEKMDKGIFQQIEKKIDKIELRRAQTKLRKQVISEYLYMYVCMCVAGSTRKQNTKPSSR